MNLNGFINPQSHGRFLRTYSQFGTQQEGFSYLGIGVLFILLCTGIELAAKGRKEHIKEYVPLALGIGASFCIAFYLSVFPTIAFGGRILKHFVVGPVMLKVWGTFRASGRISWVCIYILYVFAICGDHRVVSVKRKNIIMLVALLLQIVDISGYIAEKHDILTTEYTYTTTLACERWDTLLKNGEAEHLVFMEDYEIDKYGDLTYWAMNRGVTTNDFYFARNREEKDQLQDDAAPGYENDTIYVWDRETFVPAQAELYYYDIDPRFVVGYTEQIKGLPLWGEE